MNADVAEPTWSVTELHEAVTGLIEHAFGSTVWVSGELTSLHRSRQGHAYFDLVEPGGDTQGAARLSVTLFKGHRQRVNSTIKRAGDAVRIEEGTILRIAGELKTYPAQSRLQLVMTGIDPTYTMGVAQLRRDLTMAALAADGLLELNSRLEFAHPPLHVAVVTSRGSAAEADVVQELRSSGIGFRLNTIDARTQGTQAERTLVAALLTADELAADVILLVRGGGSRADLGVFDSEWLGRTIASLTTPVLTGIGHETDHSVADEVAHHAHKTPTAAAASVVERVQTARREFATSTASVSTAARGRALRAELHLDASTRTTAIACRGHLARETTMIEERLARAATAAPLRLDRVEIALSATTFDLGREARSLAVRATTRMDQLSALITAHDPGRLLAAGWSITHTENGGLVNDPDAVRTGTGLVSTVAGGKIRSVVTATEKAASSASTDRPATEGVRK